jgi:hypothetical protein
MREVQAPVNRKAREVITIRILCFFTLVKTAVFKGGNYKPINIRMLNRSTRCPAICEKNRVFKCPAPSSASLGGELNRRKGTGVKPGINLG